MARVSTTPQEVLDLLRQMTGQSVLLSEAIARHVGLSPSDLEVLGAIEQHGPLTAGQLGKLTGLSPAAVTGLIDRLERAGVAARRSDTTDRRRVLVEVSAGAREVADLYVSLEQDVRRTLDGCTPAQLRVTADLLHELYKVGVKHVERLERPARRRPS
jgi:DNA-binding MarR family transcriptional regulator